MGVNFYAVDNLISAFEFVILSIFISVLLLTIVIGLILRYDRSHELKVTPVQLLVDQLVHQLAHCLAVAHPQTLHLDVPDVGQAELLEIREHLVDCILYFPLEVLEIDVYAGFLALNTNAMRIMI